MPATGRSVCVQQIHIFRLQDGMLAEHWACRDDLGGLRQLGALADLHTREASAART